MRASGLARDGDRQALGLKVLGKLAQLSRFAGTVESFEGEEEAHKGRVQDWPSRRTRFAPE
jgi:hypothetical protein